MIPVAFLPTVPGAGLIRAFSFGVGLLLLLEVALTAYLFEVQTRNPDGVWHVLGGGEGGQDAVLLLRQSAVRQLLSEEAGVSYMATSHVTLAAKSSLVLVALLTAVALRIRSSCRAPVTSTPVGGDGAPAVSPLSSQMKRQEERMSHAIGGMALWTVAVFSAVTLLAAFDVVPVLRSSALASQCPEEAPQLPSGRCLPADAQDRAVVQSNLLELAASNYIPFLFCLLAVFTTNGSRRYVVGAASFAAFNLFLSNFLFSFVPILAFAKPVAALTNAVTSALVLLPPMWRLLCRGHRERTAQETGAGVVNIFFFSAQTALDDAGLPKSVTRGPEEARDPRAAAPVKGRLIAAAARVQRRLDLGAVGGLAWLTLVNVLLNVYNTTPERQVVVTLTAWMVSNTGVFAAYSAVVMEAHRRLRMSALNEEIAREARQTEALERRLLLLISAEAFVPFSALQHRASQLQHALKSLPRVLDPEGAAHSSGGRGRDEGKGKGNTGAPASRATPPPDLRPALRTAVAEARAQWEPLQDSVNASVGDMRTLLRDAKRWGAASASAPRLLRLRKALFQPVDVAREVATAFFPQAHSRGVAFSLSFAGLLSPAAAEGGDAPRKGEQRGPRGAHTGGRRRGGAVRAPSAEEQGASPPPPPRVCGDAIRVRQLVSNLVRVSLQLTPPGGSVHLTVSLLPTAGGVPAAEAERRQASDQHNPLSLLAPGQEVTEPLEELSLRCTVEDNGVGLTEEEQDGVLQPAEGPAILRAAQARAAQPNPRRRTAPVAQTGHGGGDGAAPMGAGNPLEDAGLGVAALLAEVMGGTLGVFSAGQDRGSTLWFRVTLPTREGPEVGVATSSSASAGASSTRRSSSHGVPATTEHASGSDRDREGDGGNVELDRHLGVDEATSDDGGSPVGSPHAWNSDVPTSPEPDGALLRGSGLSMPRSPATDEPSPPPPYDPRMSAHIAMGLTEDSEGPTPLVQTSPCSSRGPGSANGSVETRAPSDDGE